MKANYSLYAYKTLLESFVALGKVHAPDAPPPKAITDRILQIATEHWETRTKTRPLRLPGDGS